MTGHRLRAALLLVRHGDRGPLLPSVRDLSTIDCGVPTGLSPRLSAIYRNYSHLALDRTAAGWRGATLGSFSRTPLLPTALCRPGRLSQRGLLQLLQLGDQLQQRYVPLLADAAPLLYFAPSERGLQSAAALGFGLAGQAPFRAGAGWLRVTRDADLCLSGCGCAAARRLHTRAVVARRRLLARHPAMAELVARLGALVVEGPPAPATPPLGPGEIQDALLAAVCHGAPLPCDGSDCVAAADAAALQAFTRWERQQRTSADWGRAARLRMRGLFSELHRLLSLVAAGSGQAPGVVAFVAGEQALTAALRALGVRSLSAFLQPPYASRLAIEVYSPDAAVPGSEHSLSGRAGFRLVYNGDDVTRLLPMCTDSPLYRYDLCPLDVLLNFTGPGYLSLFGNKTYEKACQ